MSHFVVAVIGHNIDEQLAPYHEFECTGVNDEYVQEVDVTDECKEHGLDWHGLEEATVTDLDELDIDDKHKYGYALVDGEGNLIKAVQRTNPNAKWDWYQVGGRWSGMLKLKEGATGENGERSWMNRDKPDDLGHVDSALKGAIDFEGMRDNEGTSAGDLYDKLVAAKVAAGYAEDAMWEPWEVVRERYAGDIDTARDVYHNHPVLKAVRDTETVGFLWNPDEFLVSRDEYVRRARMSAGVPYAVVKDGEWFAKGEMGWFGMSSDTCEQEEWGESFHKLIDSLPDDTPITIVDCHI